MRKNKKTDNRYKDYIIALVTGLMVLMTVTFAHQATSREQYIKYTEIRTQAVVNDLVLRLRRADYSALMDSLESIDTEELKITEEVEPEISVDTADIEDIESFISKKFPNSPIKDKINIFFEQGYKKGFTDKQIKLLIAISGTESGFGTHAKYHNFFGIMCKRDGNYTTNCGWEDDYYAIGRAYDLVGSYLKRWNGDNTEQVFIGQGKYCTSSCSNWVSSTEYFISEFL